MSNVWENNFIGFYKWHKRRSYNTAYCGTYVHPEFSSKMDRSSINESALCKICVRILDKRRGV